MGVLEVIATSAEDAVAAERGGADRLEVCRDLEVGGLTPAAETVAQIWAATALPLRVMLRANGGFGTDAAELADLCRVAAELRAVGAAAFVFGFLTPDGALDLAALGTLAAAVAPCPWTLHRAFDHAADPAAAWAAAAILPGLDLVLTGGGPAGFPRGIEALRARASWQSASVHWLAGGGLRAEHIPALRAAGITQFHAGRAARLEGRWDRPVDTAAVRRLRAAVGRSGGRAVEQ